MNRNPFVVYSLSNLPSLSHEGLQSLNALGINTISQLLQYEPLESAQILEDWVFKKIKHDINLKNYLNGDISNLASESILNLEIEQLRGIGARGASLWYTGFKVKTIRDLLNLTIISEARNVIQFSDFYERTSAPNYLIPKPREHSKTTYHFKTWTLLKRLSLAAANLRWEAKDSIFQSILSEQKLLKNKWFSGKCPVNAMQKAIRTTIQQRNYVRFYLGYLLITQQNWAARDLTLGDVSHTIGLAPGQSKRVATVQWNRYKRAQRLEDTVTTETLDSEVYMEQSAQEQIHDMTLKKTRDAETEFETSYEQKTRGIGGSFGTGSAAGASAAWQYKVLNLAGAANTGFGNELSANQVSSSGSQEGYVREDVTETTNLSGKISSDVSNYTKQSATSVRSLRSTVVLEDSEAETESATTTVLTNYNHSHALNIQCYELLRRYGVSTVTDELRPIIYIPFQPICFNQKMVAELWDYLRYPVRLYDHNRFKRWDSAIRSIISYANVIPSAENTEIVSLFVENPFRQEFTLKFKLKDTDNIELSIPARNSKHDLEDAITPASISMISIESKDSGFLSRIISANTYETGSLELVFVLKDSEGNFLHMPYRLELERRSNLLEFFRFSLIEGSNGDISDAIDTFLHARYMAYQADIYELVDHLNDHSLAYARYLLLKCNPAELERCMDQVFLNYKGDKIPLAELADITKLLGITGTHLIYPLLHFQVAKRTNQIAKGKVWGKIEFEKEGCSEFKETPVRLIHDQQAQLIILEFEIGSHYYSFNESQSSKIKMEINYKNKEEKHFINGNMSISNFKPEGDLMDFELYGKLQLDNILKGSIIGDISNFFVQLNFDCSWDTIEIFKTDEPSSDIEENINEIWQKSIEMKKEGEYELVDLPTSGLFWEAVLGISNASEYIDPRRFTAWHEWPIPYAATDIAPIQMGQKKLTETDELSPTPTESTLQQVEPKWFQPFGALSQMMGNMLSAQSARGNADILLGVSANLADLAKTAGEQASSLTGSMAADAMKTAVDFGKQVADMTNKAMGTLKGGPGVGATPPATQTGKAGALNFLDELGGSSSGSPSTISRSSDLGASSSGSTEPKMSSNQIDNAKAGVMGAPIMSSSTLSMEELLSQAENELATARNRFTENPTEETARALVIACAKMQTFKEYNAEADLLAIEKQFSKAIDPLLAIFKSDPSVKNYKNFAEALSFVQQYISVFTIDWLDGVERLKASGKYTIVEGDSLSKIAEQYYKETWRWPAIYEVNMDEIGKDPDLLEVGLKIDIP